ncbi:Variant-specific surface protein, partial [Giardia duodenalis]
VNDPAGVSIDSLCRPSSSPQATVAGCTGSDGAALTDASTACGMCSGSGFFLFRGGCYEIGEAPGNEICTAAEGGKCTTCKTDTNYIFQNRAAVVTLGNECILCSDATNRDGYQGVENCNKCTAPAGNTGAATCSACQDGYYKDTNGACAQCNTNSCLTCKTSATQCTSCPEGKYLKSDNTCVTESGCTTNQYYLDKVNRKCLACSTAITGCTECELDDTTGKPKCTKCGDGQTNIPRTALDGISTCVTKGYAGCQGDNNELFMKEDQSACLLCGDATTGTDKDQGTANCKTCTKTGSTKPECTACQDGFYLHTDKTCQPCAPNCATCTSADMSTCNKCLPGYFLKTGSTNECVLCGDTAKGGREGCSTCSNDPAFKCTGCKPNYRRQQNGGASDDYTCTKTCEDPTACGDTAGSCGAIVIGTNGEMTYYCSLCADNSQYPIDGICNSVKGSNTCADGVCTSCTTGYFLYMGGCYSTTSAPGNLMCSKATTAGVCDTPNANSRYFKVPGAKATDQSVLGCGNPLGTTVGDNAYVGVEGCKTCEAPTAPSPAGIAAAKCTACDESDLLHPPVASSAVLLGPSPAGRPKISRVNSLNFWPCPEAKVGLD